MEDFNGLSENLFKISSEAGDFFGKKRGVLPGIEDTTQEEL